jgi:hypothetical protein
MKQTNYLTASTRCAGRMLIAALLLFQSVFLVQCNAAPQDKDVLRVMTYNVLRYGDGCQGPNSKMHGYLQTIIGYADPDILGLVKVAAIPQAEGNKSKAPAGFADSILINALNAAKKDKYAYCPFTNAARDNDQAILFYNKHKLGYVSMATLVSDLTDFNIYKLYYKDINLPKTHDTSFIYIVLVHTDSGDKPGDRNRQLAELMSGLRKYFASLHNIIIMGDFNFRKSKEEGYQLLTENAEAAYRFLDPPFAIDKKIEYPANWDKHEEQFAPYLTTSTRKSETQPNDCGTGGGAKSWYDHFFLAPRLADRKNFFHYVRGSYRTIGNDGKRINMSVNDMPNSSAPAGVLDALYHMSNKYPVMIELGVNPR